MHPHLRAYPVLLNPGKTAQSFPISTGVHQRSATIRACGATHYRYARYAPRAARSVLSLIDLQGAIVSRGRCPRRSRVLQNIDIYGHTWYLVSGIWYHAMQARQRKREHVFPPTYVYQVDKTFSRHPAPPPFLSDITATVATYLKALSLIHI